MTDYCLIDCVQLRTTRAAVLGDDVKLASGVGLDAVLDAGLRDRRVATDATGILLRELSAQSM